MPESIDLATLGRYFTGTASADEHDAVRSWIRNDPDRRAAAEALRAAWVADVRRFEAPFDADGAWARFLAGLEQTSGDTGGSPSLRTLDPSSGPARPVRRVPLRQPVWSASGRGMWVAAAFAAAVVGVGSWFATRSDPTPPANQPVPIREYATARGQRATVRLLDGTEVLLNVESRLRVPGTFGTPARQVYLEGEAYFRVAHDTAHPFVVYTARGVTRDVGTAFNIRAYRDDAAERVAVLEGAVAVAPAPVSSVFAHSESAAAVRSGSAAALPETPLHAGQIATLSNADEVSVARAANVRREIAWAQGRLEFERAPLGDVARQLGRWYDLDIRITDPDLARRRVTGSYGEEPIAHVLTVITAAVGARYDWRGRAVTISLAGAP